MTNPTEPTTSKLDQPFPYPHHNRHPWMQPGDHPNRYWWLRFDDPDMRDMLWDGPDAEAQARAAYAQYSPSWNVYLFATLPAVDQSDALQSAEASLARMTEERDRLIGKPPEGDWKSTEDFGFEAHLPHLLSWLDGISHCGPEHERQAFAMAHLAITEYRARAERPALPIDMNVRNVLFQKGTLLSAVESVLTDWYDEITAARNPQADAGGERLRAALEKIEEIAKNCGPDSGVREGTFGDGVAAGLRQAADVASLALSGGAEKQGLTTSNAGRAAMGPVAHLAPEAEPSAPRSYGASVNGGE